MNRENNPRYDNTLWYAIVHQVKYWLVKIYYSHKKKCEDKPDHLLWFYDSQHIFLHKLPYHNYYRHPSNHLWAFYQQDYYDLDEIPFCEGFHFSPLKNWRTMLIRNSKRKKKKKKQKWAANNLPHGTKNKQYKTLGKRG